MSTSPFSQLALDIDAAVNPRGGAPLIQGPALNQLLHELVAVLGAGASPPAASAALRTEVVQGSYNAAGELTTELSAAAALETTLGQAFSSRGATYAYLPGDAGRPVWVRSFQAATAPTPGLEVLAVAAVAGMVGRNGFNTIALAQPSVDVRPAGSAGGWDAASASYVAPLSGTYELLANMRIHDDYGPVGSNYALAAGPDNVDGQWVFWNTIFNVNGGYNRKGLQVTRVLHLAAGQPVRMYTYLDGFDAYVFGELTVKLLRRDEPVAPL